MQLFAELMLFIGAVGFCLIYFLKLSKPAMIHFSKNMENLENIV